MALTRTFSREQSIYPIKITVLLQEIHPEFGLCCYGAILRDGGVDYCSFRVWDRTEKLPDQTDCTDITVSSLSSSEDPIPHLAHFWDMIDESQGMAESDMDYLQRIQKDLVVL